MNLNHHKIKGGALQVTIYICVIVSLMLFSFILLIHIHKQIELKNNNVVTAIELSNDGSFIISIVDWNKV